MRIPSLKLTISVPFHTSIVCSTLTSKHFNHTTGEIAYIIADILTAESNILLRETAKQRE